MQVKKLSPVTPINLWRDFFSYLAIYTRNNDAVIMFSNLP